ncbi:MAG: Nif3-like dinuclear metal center hexameric protein [Candidatus Zipacnadales bacterium]
MRIIYALAITGTARRYRANCPVALAEPWDNVGLQLGQPDQLIDNVLLTVEVTKQVLSEAMTKNARAIVSHHPVFFNTMSSLRYDQWPGCIVAPLMRADLAVYVAHTNLDWSPQVNTSAVLAQTLGLENLTALRLRPDDNAAYLGVVADCSSMTVTDLAKRVMAVLKTEDIRLTSTDHTATKRVGVVAGSAKGLEKHIIAAGATCLIAGEVGHHMAVQLAQLSVSTIEIGHAVSEWPAIARLADILRQTLGHSIAVCVSKGDALAE